MGIVQKLLGKNGGEKVDDFENMARRESFSKFLPYVAYDDVNKIYITNSEEYGYIWECQPKAFIDEQNIEVIAALLQRKYTKGAMIQFSLYADPDYKDIIEKYISNKTRLDEISKETIHGFARYILSGRNGLDKIFGNVVRNFKLIVSLKVKEPLTDQELSNTITTLNGIGFNPKPMKPEKLIHYIRKVICGTDDETTYNDAVPINKQIISASTKIEVMKDHLILGEQYATCLTPKILDEKINPINANKFSGGYEGSKEDLMQIPCPFVWNATVLLDDQSSSISSNASWIIAQKSPGKFAIKIGKRQEECYWALTESEKNKKFIRIIPSLWLFCKDKISLDHAASRAASVWDACDCETQRETFIQSPMLISSLPLGLYASENNIKVLDRHFYMTPEAAACFLPTQADFRGILDNPVCLFVGNKGQLVGLDIYDKRASSKNILICAPTGKGKTQLLQFILDNYHATGSLIRLTDIGYGYERLCATKNGRFMDFGKDKICINPFHSIGRDEEDANADTAMTANTLGEMVYSISKKELTDNEYNLLKEAIRFAKKRDNGIYGVDHVYEYLSSYPDKCGEIDAEPFDFLTSIAKSMGYNIGEFTSKGNYGRIFNGPSDFDISSDDFVILELERLKNDPQLFNVIMLQVMNSVTQDLYLSDRSKQRLVMFEEAWQYFKDGSRIGSMIEEGYRRARRYGGCFGIVTQSPNDLPKFGPAGEVISENSPFKFYLENRNYDAASQQGNISQTGFALDMLKRIKLVKPHYSELYMETPFGEGVGRLILDPFSSALYSSESEDYTRFKQLINSGMGKVEAIYKCLGI